MTDEDGELLFEDLGCFGCSKTNDAGLGLRFFRRGDGVGGEVTLAPKLSGWPGVAHGGVVATVLDEFSCAASYAQTGVHVMTGEMNIRYEGACPVDVPVQVQARVLDESHPRYVVAECSIDHDGKVVARSTGKFFRMKDQP